MDIKNPNADKYGRIEEAEEKNEFEPVIEYHSEEKKHGWRNRKKQKAKKAVSPDNDIPEETTEEAIEAETEPDNEETQQQITETFDYYTAGDDTDIGEDYANEQKDEFEGIDVSKYGVTDYNEESVDDILKSIGMLEEESDEQEQIEENEPEQEEISDEISDDFENEDEEIFVENDEEPETETDAEIAADEIDAAESIEESADETVEETQKENEDEIVVSAEPKKKKKEKKVKEKKPKEKKVKEQKPKQEKEPLGKKDYVTIVIAIIAVLAIAAFAVYYVKGDPSDNKPIETTTQQDQLSDVQIIRTGTVVDLIQSDIPDVFYGVTPDYSIRYYQFYENEMHAAKATNNISLTVDLGSASVPVKIDYVELGGKLFGFGLFTAEEGSEVYYYDMVAFKITDLPAQYKREGHALLLATTSRNALTSNAINWTESFDLNLETGETSRFLKIINRRTDSETGNYESNFCLMGQASYTSTSEKIPFFTSREYPLGVDMQDIFVKTGSTEKLLASDVYGKYFVMDKDTIIYMRKTTTGFSLVYNTNGEEEVKQDFYGLMNSSYINYREYILSKADGKLYNLKTLETKTLIGYSMSNPDYFCVSDDGKYLIVIGTVKNALDYQIQMFNLETGEYAKMEDKNYSQHSNLCFINNKTAAYCVLDPNQGFEYVVLDLEKAFN